MRRKTQAGRSGLSRRDFCKSAGAGLVMSELAIPGRAGNSTPATSQVVFTPRGGLVQISPNLCLLRDTCNVYLLKDGPRALLIDFGSGHILKLLGEIGVTQVDGILHTHHHRDQCQGDPLAVAGRIPIHVPAQERELFRRCGKFLAQPAHFREQQRSQ